MHAYVDIFQLLSAWAIPRLLVGGAYLIDHIQIATCGHQRLHAGWVTLGCSPHQCRPSVLPHMHHTPTAKHAYPEMHVKTWVHALMHIYMEAFMHVCRRKGGSLHVDICMHRRGWMNMC